MNTVLEYFDLNIQSISDIISDTIRDTIFVVYGPTGSGKTDLSLWLAEQFAGEIVNADIAQCYKPLTIGTAKPDFSQAKFQRVKHHLFDIFDAPVSYSAHAYRQDCLTSINLIRQDKKTPIVVGGCGFYLKTLFFPLSSYQDMQDSYVLQNVQDISKQHDTSEKTWDKTHLNQENLWSLLHAIDPSRASSIHKNDVYRIKRALAIWEKTGRPPSAFKPTFDFQLAERVIFLYVDRDPEELKQRISMRFDQMLAMGWLDEVKSLNSNWEEFIRSKNFIGYPELFDHIKRVNFSFDNNLKELKELIVQKTNAYVKSQRTFWRGFKRLLEAEAVKPENAGRIFII